LTYDEFGGKIWFMKKEGKNPKTPFPPAQPGGEAAGGQPPKKGVGLTTTAASLIPCGQIFFL